MKPCRFILIAIACLALCAGAPATRAGGVDGERALSLIRQQCAFGPRVPGTAAHRQCADWLREQIKTLKMTAVEQPFDAAQPLINARAAAVNFYALPSADGPSSPALLIMAHWDTRPYADRDPSGDNPAMLGANDGGSGVALALELARALQDAPQRRHIALLLHDAEDAGNNQSENSWCVGAQYAAARAPKWISRVKLAINLDMVAGEGSTIKLDPDSKAAAPQAAARLWEIGRALQPGIFDATPQTRMLDDHIAWIKAGVPSLNLLGLPWQYWHTAGDRPEHCSAAYMQGVGEVVTEFIREQIPAPAPGKKS